MSSTAVLRVVVIGAAFASLLAVPVRSQQAKGKSHALLIGVKDYGENGALALAEVHRERRRGTGQGAGRRGSPFRGNVRVLTCTANGQERHHRRERPQGGVGESVQVSDRTASTVLIALAGHGIQLEVKDREGDGDRPSYAYFCPRTPS